jgi:hypothetical protein
MAKIEEAIQKLYSWQYGFRDSNDFSFQLYTLMQLASPEEFDKLAQSYPDEARAYRLWYESPDPVEFFKAHGAWKGPRPRE